MFKSGQIWERTYPGGKYQVGLIVGDYRLKRYKVFVLSGWNSGCYVYWYHNVMLHDFRDNMVVQLA